MDPLDKQPYKIMPLRLDPDLLDKINEISRKTHITKTELSRIAITQFIQKMDDSGAAETMMRLCEA